MPSFSSFTRRATAAAAAVFALGAGSAEASSSVAPPAGWKPFAADSIWNLPTRADNPIHSNSATWMRWMTSTIANKGTWINQDSCGMPTYWAPAGTPRVRVRLDGSAYQEPALIKAWSSVPMPSDARPATCSDSNFAVLQRQSDGTVTQWEFWRARKDSTGAWVANWGGVTQDIANDRGIASTHSWINPNPTSSADRTSKPNWNVTASSVAMTAGVVTQEQLRAGVIDHAVSIAIPDGAKGKWLWPAQRTDGGLTASDAMPEGARLRLNPNVNIDALQLTPFAKMLAKAAQKYGLVVRDKAYSATVVYVEPTRAGESNALPATMGGKGKDTVLSNFPWGQLQVLDAPVCTDWNGCSATQKAVISVNGQATAGSPVQLDTTNSVLNHPRTAVAWDLDGNGSYETAAGKAVTHTFTPGEAGTVRIGVRMATRDGSVVTGTRDLAVGTSNGEPAPEPEPEPTPEPTPTTPTTPTEPAPTTPTTPTEPAPTTPTTPTEPTTSVPTTPTTGAVTTTAIRQAPAGVSAFQWFSADGSGDMLKMLNEAVNPPAIPYRYRRAYARTDAAVMTVRFGGTMPAGATTASVRAYVQCAAARCARLQLLAADGTVLGKVEPSFGSTGWVELRANRVLAASEIAGLRLRVSADRFSGTTSNETSVSGVSLILAPTTGGATAPTDTTTTGTPTTGTTTVGTTTPVPTTGTTTTTAVRQAPAGTSATGFFAYAGEDLRAAISEAVDPGATPYRYRKAYSRLDYGALTVRFGGTATTAPATATVRAYVDCTGARCMRLSLVAADGTVLAKVDPAFGQAGWVQLRASRAIAPSEVSGLRLKVTTHRTLRSTSDMATISAVSLLLQP